MPSGIRKTYAEAGGYFIDTANMYTGGEIERIVGRLVADDRERRHQHQVHQCAARQS